MNAQIWKERYQFYTRMAKSFLDKNDDNRAKLAIDEAKSCWCIMRSIQRQQKRHLRVIC